MHAKNVYCNNNEEHYFTAWLAYTDIGTLFSATVCEGSSSQVCDVARRLPTSAMSSADDDYNSAILTGPILPWLSRLQNEGSSHGSLNCLLLLLLFSICADQPAALYHNLPQIAKRSGWPFNCWKGLLISTLHNRRLTGKRTGYE